MNPRILLGCPTSFHKEYALKEYLEAVKKIDYDNFDVLLVDNSKDDKYFNKIKDFGVNVVKGPYFEGARDRIIASRNLLKEKVVDEGYNYFFSLEQDVIVEKDVLKKLVKHGKEVVSGVYFARNVMGNTTELIPLAYVKIDNKKPLPSMRPINVDEFESDELMEIVSCGLGCVLIHRDVLKEFEFRYDKESEAFDDRFFCIDLFNKNIKMYCDTSIKCKHLIKDRPYKWRDIKK